MFYFMVLSQNFELKFRYFSDKNTNFPKIPKIFPKIFVWLTHFLIRQVVPQAMQFSNWVNFHFLLWLQLFRSISFPKRLFLLSTSTMCHSLHLRSVLKSLSHFLPQFLNAWRIWGPSRVPQQTMKIDVDLRQVWVPCLSWTWSENFKKWTGSFGPMINWFWSMDPWQFPAHDISVFTYSQKLWFIQDADSRERVVILNSFIAFTSNKNWLLWRLWHFLKNKGRQIWFKTF